ncbi:MAG: hypothetical protein IJS93_03050 [Clostridia bacterium]|nr:hypothetical protein [Clostridia bacterium]
MELLDFIEKHENWRELLKEPPYSLNVKEDEGFTLLKYEMLNSDFSIPLVNECRGIILDSNNKIVCFPFYKFFNYGEVYADKIDWSTARVQQKVDGSIMKLWCYDGKWRLSTNGSVNAYNAKPDSNWSQDYHDITFGELFESAVNYKDIDFSSLDPNYTYIFELTSPYAKVVIQYPETSIWHLGTRDNRTFQELDVDIGVKKPASYPLKTMQDCIEAAKALPSDQEGFVVVDAFWKRIKIKNPTYLRLHRMIANRHLQRYDVVKMLLENEQDEFLCYFPEYKPAFDEFKRMISKYKTKLETTFAALDVTKSRKDIAAEIMSKDADNSFYYFRRLGDENYSVEIYLLSLTKEKVLAKLQIKEEYFYRFISKFEQ